MKGLKMLPKIDCYYVPALQLGETIATELLDNLTGKKTKEISKRFMPEYIERGSVKRNRMIESILVEDESSMLFSTGKLPEKQVFLCNRKFLGIPYYIKRH